MARDVKVYTFDELSEDAKKVAIDKMRYQVAEDLNSFDATDYMKSIDEFCKFFNAASTGSSYSDVSYRGDDYDEHTNEEGIETAETVKDFVKNIVDYYEIDLDNLGFTGVFTDAPICEYLQQVLNGEENPISIDDFFYEMSRRIKKDWESTEFANTEDEVVADMLSSNNYEFLEDGTPF